MAIFKLFIILLCVSKVTHREGSKVWVREHVRMRESPRRVSSGVVYQNSWICAVGHVHKHVVTVSKESVLQMRHFNLIVDHQICQKSVASQDFCRQCHAPHLKIAIHTILICCTYKLSYFKFHIAISEL